MSAARGCEPASRANGSLCAIVQRVAIRARTNYASACDLYLSATRRTAERRASVFAESLKPETHATLRNPYDQSILDSCAAAGNCLCREIKAALCFVLRRIDLPRPRPDKLRAYKCSIRRRRLIVCAGVCFHPVPDFEHRASSSRGRDCGRNQLAGNAGLFRLTRFVGRLYDYMGFILREEALF